MALKMDAHPLNVLSAQSQNCDDAVRSARSNNNVLLNIGVCTENLNSEVVVMESARDGA
jgi:hypothetical protein